MNNTKYYAYDKDGQLYRSFTREELNTTFNHSKATSYIIQCIKARVTAFGYRWRYKKLSHICKYPFSDSKKKTYHAYHADGTYFRSFLGIEAIRNHFVSVTAGKVIYDALDKKDNSYLGYYWRTVKTDTVAAYQIKRNTWYHAYTLNGLYYCAFNREGLAERFGGKAKSNPAHNVSMSIKRNQIAYGYLWSRTYDTKEIPKMALKKLYYAYYKDGTFFRAFRSIKGLNAYFGKPNASKHINNSIKKNYLAYNFIWRREYVPFIKVLPLATQKTNNENNIQR